MDDKITPILLSLILIFIIIFGIVLVIIGVFFISDIIPVFKEIGDDVTRVVDTLGDVRNDIGSIKTGLSSIYKFLACILKNSPELITKMFNLLFNSKVSVRQLIKIINNLVNVPQNIKDKILTLLDSITSDLEDSTTIVQLPNITPDQVQELKDKLNNIIDTSGDIKSIIDCLSISDTIKDQINRDLSTIIENTSTNKQLLRNIGNDITGIESGLNSNDLSLEQLTNNITASTLGNKQQFLNVINTIKVNNDAIRASLDFLDSSTISQNFKRLLTIQSNTNSLNSLINNISDTQLKSILSVSSINILDNNVLLTSFFNNLGGVLNSLT